MKINLFFFVGVRKLRAQYGEMGCTEMCGRWILKVRCGEWLDLCILIIGVVSFWRVSLLSFLPIDRVVTQGCALLSRLF